MNTERWAELGFWGVALIGASAGICLLLALFGWLLQVHEKSQWRNELIEEVPDLRLRIQDLERAVESLEKVVGTGTVLIPAEGKRTDHVGQLYDLEKRLTSVEQRWEQPAPDAEEEQR